MNCHFVCLTAKSQTYTTGQPHHQYLIHPTKFRIFTSYLCLCLCLCLCLPKLCLSKCFVYDEYGEKNWHGMEEFVENWGRKKEKKSFEWYKEWWGLVQKEGITVMITHSRYCWLVILVLARAAFFSVSYLTLFMICLPPLVPSLSHQHFLHVLFEIQKPWF